MRMSFFFAPLPSAALRRLRSGSARHLWALRKGENSSK